MRINEALANAVGCSVEECTGKSVRELSPPALWPVIEPALRRVAERGESIHDYEFSGQTGGTRRRAPLDRQRLSRSRARASGSYGVGAVVRDVTGRVRGAERERTQARRREQSYALADALVGAVTTREVIAAVVEHGAAAMDADGCVVALRSPDGKFIDLLGADGMPSDVAAEWQRFAIGAPTPLSYVARTGEPLFLESAADWHAHFPALARLAADVGHSANVVVPLAIGGEPIGALGLAFEKARRFSEDERAFALILARQCSLALERARLLEAERDSTQRGRRGQRGEDAVPRHDEPRAAHAAERDRRLRRAARDGDPWSRSPRRSGTCSSGSSAASITCSASSTTC